VLTSIPDGGAPSAAWRTARRATLRAALYGPLLAALPAIAHGTEASGDARLRELLERARGAAPAVDPAQREAQLAAGEAALRAGDAETAILHFERAGFVRHAADAEIGLIRAYMQAGAYRRALAFAAHTAGAHPDVGAGAGLYAWLLHLGGQTRFATQVLARGRARQPGHDGLAALADALQASVPPRAVAWPGLPLSPCSPDSSALPASARVVTGATRLCESARVALAPVAPVRERRELWVRDGCGGVAAARVHAVHDDLGLAELELLDPLAGADELAALASGPVRPGRPALAADADTAGDGPAWPRVRVEFFGTPDARGLTLALPPVPLPGALGAPVFDDRGYLAGVAAGSATALRVVTAPALRARLRAVADASPPERRAPAAPRMPIDEIYEQAMRQALQVVAA
jgi:hypothetical protein